MSGTLLLMSVVLGLGSFLVGILPLSFAFSKLHVSMLSTLGTGLLIGTALGVIIPEGVEAVVSSHSRARTGEAEASIPSSMIALSLLTGFVLMLAVEQLLAPHSHSPSFGPASLHEHSTLEFDAELDELAHVGDAERPSPRPGSHEGVEAAQHGRGQAIALTLGLFIHALADGLALGASFLPSNQPSSSQPFELSFIVFMALMVHKAPTALALTTSLLATSLPRPECRKHLALFSASTPVGAILTYYLMSYLSSGTGHDWTGAALLFSGGTFLYVATVLQPASGHKEDLSKGTRVGLITLGMFVPFTLGSVLGHGHEH
ncbi:Zinc/iron permease [Pleurotus eryngii]|uniref:Zinc/iron permease n=1 Tax=Pleurotus eryngii TaxID=5323 RepID=A0A9P5ZZJ6_PLEER|nr:Zinc/iron permease [Pleurotus eryngii]